VRSFLAWSRVSQLPSLVPFWERLRTPARLAASSAPMIPLRCASPISLRMADNVMDQDIAAPPMLDRCLEVPFRCGLVFEAVEQDHVVPPGQLCSKLLHNWLLDPGLGERPHVFETSWAEA
jgi:hypothetical protein